MSSSGTLYGNFSSVGTAVARPYIEWSITQSSSGNYSDVTAVLKYVKYNSAYGSYNASHSVTLTINGDGNTGNYAFDLRPKLYPVLEQSGFKKEAVLKKQCLFNLEYIDVVIHSKFIGE